MKKIAINYCPAVIIVHGKSEFSLVSYIKSSLHLPIEIESKDKGEHSIQITSLNNFLQTQNFKTKNEFKKKYIVNEEEKKLTDFKVFIIMDTDDCTESQKKAYIDKSMFKNHWLYEYIVPIYSIPNLEKVVKDIGMHYEKIENKDKAKTYIKIFPMVRKAAVDISDYNDIRQLSEKIKNVKSSNLDLLLDYCLEHCKLKGQ